MVMSIEKEILQAVKKGNICIGSKIVFKMAKRGKIEEIFYAKNCPEDVVKNLNYYAKISKIKIVAFDGDSKRLGQICGKPFSTLMVGICK